jgi:hypothetical protein
MRTTLSINARMTREAHGWRRVEVPSTTVSSQPSSNLVLNRPHSPTFHNAKAFVDLQRWQFPQIKPVFIYRFPARGHEVRIHRRGHFNPYAEIAFDEGLRLKTVPILLSRRPAEPLKCRQASKDDPGFAATESEVLVVPVDCSTILKDLNHGTALIERFIYRKIRVLASAPGRALAVRALSLIHAGVKRTTFFSHDRDLPSQKRGYIRSRSLRVTLSATSAEAEVSSASLFSGCV